MKTNRYIKLNNNVVVSVRYGSSIVAGETASDVGEIGQVYNPDDGMFTTPAAPAEPAIDVAKAIQDIKDHYVASSVLIDKIKQKLGIV